MSSPPEPLGEGRIGVNGSPEERVQKLPASSEQRRRRREQIRARMDQIEQELQQLQAEYAALAPLTLVPPEVISSIFEEYVAECWRPILSDPYIRTHCRPYEWLKLLSVCRHWREIALRTPRIWTFITTQDIKKVNLMLSRSGKCPLTIVNRPPSIATLEPVYRAVIPELSRVRKAEFEITSSVQSLFSSGEQSPALQHLILQDLAIVMHTGMNTLGALSSADMPLLKSLKIQSGSPSLVTSLVRPTLTTLIVKFSPAVNAALVVELLQGLPFLQDLQLSNIASFGMSEFPVIPLPHLHKLELSGNPPSLGMAALLRCLDFPQDTEIRYSSIDSPLGLEEIGLVLPLVMASAIASSRAVLNNPAAAFRPYAIELEQDYGLSAELLAAPSDNSDYRPTRLSLSIGDGTDESLVQMYRHLNLTEVRYMNVAVPMSPELWLRAFENQALLKLEKLCLSGESDVEEFLEMLNTPLPPLASSAAPNSQEDEEQPVTPSTRFTFPNLKILELHGMGFRERNGVVRETDYIERLIPSLRQFTMERGSPLDELHITWPMNLTLEADLAALMDPSIAKFTKIDPSDVEDWGFSTDSIRKNQNTT
ncbi:hypothetical protein NM688_g1830 [Phlebia brevispora]|uniref:Uncharacterized protein n=1 Tax=Phlebia brevispora TaxID=194682 RepID=A0ACC1T9Z8_9APHY|nr:hypothetical protein NM688_g1830 [Phlebia brevispora]